MALTKILLNYPVHVSPRLMGMLQNSVEIVVEYENYVVVGDDKLWISDVGKLLRVGETVTVCYGTYNPCLYYTDEIKAHHAELKEQDERRRVEVEQERIQRMAAIKQAAADFWASYNIPFDFTVEIKQVRSGLTEESSGNGCKRNTVLHLFVKEPIEKPKRKANVFLCTPANSGNWSDSLGEGIEYWDMNREAYTPQITCQGCLKILERFKKPAEI